MKCVTPTKPAAAADFETPPAKRQKVAMDTPLPKGQVRMPQKQRPVNFGGLQPKHGSCKTCKAHRGCFQRGSSCEKCVKKCRQLFGHQRLASLQPDEIKQILESTSSEPEPAPATPRGGHCRTCRRFSGILDKAENLLQRLLQFEGLLERLENFAAAKSAL